ncbi:hypothetical protein OSB04_024488 [Centaurea solstitialis]|uniref:Retrotransposon gag domain-containing protein n=1 Tax=Centaurea solstitialis TaxID=347529 RepID=A0AA38SXX4_9ASTR|nr:hypothetical protein OSB04_024488 [Centaurea solstitialis]
MGRASFKPNSLITWKVLTEKFLQKYFPPTRNVKLRNDIILFRQEEDETVSDVWERFKELSRHCPHHGIPHCIQLETFYNGLTNAAKLILDANAGGAFTSQTYNEGYQVLEKVANNNTDWSNPRELTPKINPTESDALKAMNAQLAALTKLVLNGNRQQVNSALATPQIPDICSYCDENHIFDFCPVSDHPIPPEPQKSAFKRKQTTEDTSNSVPKKVQFDLQNLLFPQRVKPKNVDDQFKKFLDIFKQLHINIPLVEALEQMPSYVKFLKDILNKKRRLGEFETVALTKECSALLTDKIPQKLKDPGSFTIPCSIGGKEVGHALCDLGASINLMPLSIFKKLGIGEARPTTDLEAIERKSTKTCDKVGKKCNLDPESEGLVEPFVEPERELRKKNKKKSKAGKVHPTALNFEMGEEAPMWNTRRTASTVPTQPIMKPNLEMEIKDAIRLRFFPFTLTGEAKAWLRSLEPSSITTWEDLRSKFLSGFFPPSKIEKLRAEIRLFRQEDEETISEAWERFKHLLNSCPSHELNKSDQVQTFYSGLNYSSAGGVFMYRTPTQVYNILEDMLIHNIDWKSDKGLHIPKMAEKISTDFDPSEELAAMKNKQVGCEECKGPHLTKDCPKKPRMTPEEVGRLSQTLSGRTQGELPTQTQVNPKVDASKTVLMVDEVTTKKAWTDIYTKKYVPSDSESEPNYAIDYDSEGITLSFEHLLLRDPIYLSDEEEEDSKQGGYAEFMIPKPNKEKEKAKEEDAELTYVAPTKHDPGSYSLPFFVSNKKMKIKKLTPTTYQYRRIYGYMTTPLGIAEAVPIRIGSFVYLTDFIVADLPKDTEIPIIFGRAFLHTAQVNVDMRNQVTTLGYGDKRISFNPNGEPVTHLHTSYVDPSQTFKEKANRQLLPHEQMKKTEDYPNSVMQKGEISLEEGTSKRGHRKKKGSSARRAKK